MPKPQDTVLTQREREVLIRVARGLTNKEIANELFTSTSAVKTFLHQACEKLGARNRAQAVILAMRQGAIQTGEVYSLEELAELLASIGPETMLTIAKLVKKRSEQARPISDMEAPPIAGH